ncbi:MAG: hypothetical protein ACP5C4_02245 [Methanomicrobiales archaeon]
MSAGAGGPRAIPVTLRIGVFGAEREAEGTHSRPCIRKVLARLDRIMQRTPHTCEIVSSCAEEAACSVVEEALDWTGRRGSPHTFEAHLPTSSDQCLAMMDDDEGRARLQSLFERAERVNEPATGDSPKSRREVTREIIHTCDLLVVIWNGDEEPGETTGELVKYARMVGRTIFLINPHTGTVREERHSDGVLESLEHIDVYNTETVAQEKIQRRVRERYLWLAGKMQISGLPSSLLQPLCPALLPQFARADLLADRYNRLYMLSGTAVYLLAAAAVATVTHQTLFLPDAPGILWLEVLEIALILLLLMGSRILDWHRKWIDYRFLAERLRVAIFLSIICITPEHPDKDEHDLFHRGGEWMMIVYREIMKDRPMEYCAITVPFEPIKTFLLEAWIDNRLSYYSRESERNRRRYSLMAEFGEMLFAVTLIAAAVHAAGLEEIWLFSIPAHTELLSAATILFPVIGAAVAAIRIQREYLRNAERYGHMVRDLSVISSQIKRTTDRSALVALLQNANEATFREHQDFRAVFRFHELEAP